MPCEMKCSNAVHGEGELRGEMQGHCVAHQIRTFRFAQLMTNFTEPKLNAVCESHQLRV